jgi:predicted flap endonuclease-1-like 5' DNA nuclease
MFKLRRILLGILLGLVFSWLWSQDSAREKPSAVPPPRPAPRRAAPSKSAKDPLIEIDGIGPAYERALNALGITTFTQLAAQDADDLAARLLARVTAERIRRERWIEQAKVRAG